MYQYNIRPRGRWNDADHTGVPEDTDGDPTGDPAGEDGEGQDWREAGATPEAGMSATRTLRPGLWLAVVLLLAACQGPREADRTGPGGDPGGGLGHTGAATELAVRRIDLPAEPWAMLAEPGGLWVVLSDRTVARYDPATTRVDGAPVRLPFTPGAVVSGHGDLWIGGQVDGRRRVTSEGSYPVIQVARVDPWRRAVTAVITLPMRSNGNRLVSTSNAVWVATPPDPDLPAGSLARIDPKEDRLTATVPLDGLATALVADGDRAWVATSGPDAILQLPS
jgi:hypothetical protein